jgi:hypothetical protein
MLGDPHIGSKIGKASDRGIGGPRENGGKTILHRDLPTPAFHDRGNRRNLRLYQRQKAQMVEPLKVEPKSASIGWVGFFSGSAGAFAGTDAAGFGAISAICRCENPGSLNRILSIFVLHLWIKPGRGRPHSIVSTSLRLREDRLCTALRPASSKKNIAPTQEKSSYAITVMLWPGNFSFSTFLLCAMRHTFLTDAGEYTDLFTLQYVAGHDNIKTTVRYVHSREAAVHKLFARLADLQRPNGRLVCN